MDKLTIEECDELAKMGFAAPCMTNVPMGEKLNFIGKQLAETMRENERLRMALKEIAAGENLLETLGGRSHE